MAQVLLLYTGSGVTSYAVHPGLVATELGRHMNQGSRNKSLISRRIISKLSKTPSQGAETSVYCAASDKLANQSGYYYSNRHRTIPSPLTWSKELADKLWIETEKLVSEYSNPIQ